MLNKIKQVLCIINFLVRFNNNYEITFFLILTYKTLWDISSNWYLYIFKYLKKIYYSRFFCMNEYAVCSIVIIITITTSPASKIAHIAFEWCSIVDDLLHAFLLTKCDWLYAFPTFCFHKNHSSFCLYFWFEFVVYIIYIIIV